MKIDYILSDTTKNATTKALKSAIELSESDIFKNIIVIVPETKSIIIEKELLSLSKNGSIANIFVYSFVRLLSRIGKVDSEKIVNRQACIVLLRKIILDNYDKLNCYKKSAKSLGFAEKIYDTIAQFKSSNITPDDLASAINGFSEALRQKFLDILVLYRAYEESLSGKLFDDCDRLNLLTEFANNSKFLKEADVFVVGFDNITYEMEAVLKEIAKNCKSITFSSVYFADGRKDLHIQNNELYKKFKHIADELKYPYVPSFFKSFESGDFYNISNYLFSTEKKEVVSKGNVKVFEASTKKDEIEFVASVITNEIKSGKRYKDIGVLACNIEENKPIIEECFNRYNIPYFINVGHDVSSHFFVKFLASAFSIMIKHLYAPEVLAFVSNPLFDDVNKSSFFNYVKAKGLNFGAFLDDPKEDLDSQDSEVVGGVLKKLKDFYLNFELKLNSCKRVKDFVDAANFVIDYFDIKNKLFDIASRQKSYGEEIEGSITEVIFDKCCLFMETLSNFMGESEVEASEFLQIYLSGFGVTKLNLSPVSIDCVVVQNNTDGFFDIKDLFIFDATDGNFPTIIDDKGIILDAEIDETIKLVKKNLEPTVSEINARENFRAYEALLEPKEKLFVSYSTKALGGASTKPARIVLRLLKLFGEDILVKNYDSADFVSNKNTELQLAQHIGEYFETNLGIKELNDEYADAELSPKFSSWIESLRFGQPSFVLDSTDGLYFYQNKTSISQLEKYFSCPYKFFGTYGLKIKQNKDAKLSKLDIGTIIHRVVELFAKDIIEFAKLSSVEFEKEINRLLNIALEEMKVSSSGNKAVLKLISTECFELCKNILAEQQVSSFKIKKTEFSFDGENADELELDDGKKLFITGKIDRIDKMGNYVRIIDYKTGDVTSSLGGIYFGKKLQLASYLSAIKKFDNSSPAGLFYLPVHSNFSEEDDNMSHYKMKGFLLDDIDVVKFFDSTLSAENPKSKFVTLTVSNDSEANLKINKQGYAGKFLSKIDFENIEKYTKDLEKQAAIEILSGYIEPSPISGLEECKCCEFAGYCGLSKAKFSCGRKLSGAVKSESFYSCEESLSKVEGNDEK